ncbi:MAG: methylmalonyl-CoA mutase family protein [Burkholderiales bacterium]|nr:methylmalonyl-CoA mutase family protein [Burkholderiales bacterium]
MTDLSLQGVARGQRSQQRLRFVTAASLFDGHDAAINIVRRLLQGRGAEVIHLGHNRSVDEIVAAAVQEDVHAIAVSSYQGGHVEFFRYMIDRLRARGAGHIQVFGGGGGVIVADEILALHAYGVRRIYTPEDGARLGLDGMITDMLAAAGEVMLAEPATSSAQVDRADHASLARIITLLESERLPQASCEALIARAGARRAPVLGITGTGGAGKSSLTDELVRRLRVDFDDRLHLAVIAIDPSRRKTGGALLGDRIRMNAIDGPHIFMRSLATRDSGMEVARCLPQAIAACRAAGFDLVVVETSGIGQGNAAIVPHVDVSLYVMTPEYGAPSQLEKIEMLDAADVVAINKFDRLGAEDALRDVRKQLQRNREAFGEPPQTMPVFGTVAARFNDDGVSALYHALAERLVEFGLAPSPRRLPRPRAGTSSAGAAIVPSARSRYLAEIAQTVRAYHRHAQAQARIARQCQHLEEARRMLAAAGADCAAIDRIAQELEAQWDPRARALLQEWPRLLERYSAEDLVTRVRDQELRTRLATVSLSGTRIPKVALPRYHDHGDLLHWLMTENVPGSFPYTAGVFALKRENEDPTRMFAGEGDPYRTNRRFHLLSQGMAAKRLSTAFDSVTLYGFDPDTRPDIYGKVGNSGVSIATLDDMKVLYSGFDLCAPDTSVSMTINGPSPAILAMFLNTAIDQQIECFEAGQARAPSAEESEAIRARTLAAVRGTVQADILKEDQGQNTCIFSTDFALKLMGDVQEFFVRHDVRNFYSVSVSGYHIAEAGANPISQLAFTLANGFTYVEAYLARGMAIDDFAPNLSFFFSYGMEPEYTVLGRVARRIWASAMRDKYGANERSQKLKFHGQTSGRSLHAQEMAFNDVRTTLQALIATYDHANSLHTNAYDEAITTPTEASVRRAMAIQLILNREWGLACNQNPNQGAFIIEALTELVEEAVLKEFERLAERGGVLGAMEKGYQRGRIQDESMLYEQRKHDGSYPIIGVNTFRAAAHDAARAPIALARSSEEEKQSQLRRLRDFHERHRSACGPALERLKQVAIAGGNVFAELMQSVRVCSLGQITHALFEVGGQYRRNM